ncbi:MAG: nucleotidyltransferase domain-containing protein [Bacteroidales bacterium]
MDRIDVEKEIVKRLIPINPDKIILFGSHAYGKPDKNSDLDICVITDSSASKSETKKKIRYLLNGIFIAKDILTPTKAEFEFYKNEAGSVYMEIDKKGKVLWPNS